MSFIVCCSFYNDSAGIKRLYESAPYLDFIFVDGRFINWNGPPLSDDGSREYLRERNLILIDAPDLIEYQKRNKYIEKAQALGFDYCLVVDSDEYVKHANIPELTLNSYRITMIQDNSPVIPYYRFHSSQARHRDRHQQCYIDDKQIFTESAPLLDVVTVHDKSLRSEKRQLYRQEYYENNPIR